MKKLIARILVFSMLVSLLPVFSLPAAADAPAPDIRNAGSIAWRGLLPAAGDSEFYVYFTGHNLLDFNAVVAAWDGYSYTPVASQVEKRLIGKTKDGLDYMAADAYGRCGALSAYPPLYYARLTDGTNSTTTRAQQLFHRGYMPLLQLCADRAARGNFLAGSGHSLSGLCLRLRAGLRR
jgi:hypothetical protein